MSVLSSKNKNKRPQVANKQKPLIMFIYFIMCQGRKFPHFVFGSKSGRRMHFEYK